MIDVSWFISERYALFCELGERRGYSSEVLEKPSIVTCQSQETSYLGDHSCAFPFHDDFYLGGIYWNSFFRHYVSQERNLSLPKFTFENLACHLFFLKIIRAFSMCSWSIFKYIRISSMNTITNVSRNSLNTQFIEHRWGIGEAKWHHYKFVVTISSSKGCFLYISVFNFNLVVF